MAVVTEVLADGAALIVTEVLVVDGLEMVGVQEVIRMVVITQVPVLADTLVMVVIQVVQVMVAEAVQDKVILLLMVMAVVVELVC